MTKLCSKCKVEKPVEEFYVNKLVESGRRASCKTCYKLPSTKSADFAAIVQNTIATGFKFCTRCKSKKSVNNFYNCKKSLDGLVWCCKECLSVSDNNRYQEKGDEIRKLVSDYQKINRSSINNRLRIRYKEDIDFKLRTILRTRFKLALHRGSKSGSAVRDLGCIIGELKVHLESLFQPGMSWDNHGEWHIDHIRPLASFDLTDRDQFLQACHYTNLQPLWAIDNLRKGARNLIPQGAIVNVR